MRKEDAKRKAITKKYMQIVNQMLNLVKLVGDSVIVRKSRRTKSSPFYDPKPYKVTQRKGNMISASREGITR